MNKKNLKKISYKINKSIKNGRLIATVETKALVNIGWCFDNDVDQLHQYYKNKLKNEIYYAHPEDDVSKLKFELENFEYEEKQFMEEFPMEMLLMLKTQEMITC